MIIEGVIEEQTVNDGEFIITFKLRESDGEQIEAQSDWRFYPLLQVAIAKAQIAVGSQVKLHGTANEQPGGSFVFMFYRIGKLDLEPGEPLAPVISLYENG